MDSRNYIFGIFIFIIGFLSFINFFQNPLNSNKHISHSDLTIPQRFNLNRSTEAVGLISSESPQHLSSKIRQSQNKLLILDEIFKNKNDNDPRLDREFKSLDRKTKKALEIKYNSLETEERNERGTIVFLLGKNLSSKSDFEFLKRVINEPTCLSLKNCKKKPEGVDPEDLTTIQITLSYPQIVALKAIENYLDHNPTSAFAKEVLNQALNVENPYVKQMANQLKTRWPN